MRIKFQQFLFGQNHSWQIVGQNLGRALIKLGHDVEFVSTDGFEQRFAPSDLLPFVRQNPTGQYDCQISYTAPHNWPNYLSHGTKNRFGIWNYEYNNKRSVDKNQSLLKGFAKFYKSTDLVLPSSNFSKEVFINMGIPNENMVVVPHGINLQDFESDNTFKLNTKKTKKILLNIAQPHRRKALHLALKAFGQAFTKEDDVCLIAKVFKQNKKDHPFDIDFTGLFKTFQTKFPLHAEVEFVYSYIPNIADLYKSCDINFSATFAECWHLPSLEALASGIINVVPRYGGQLDFCNDDNSLLIDGNIVRAPRDHQYWESTPHAVHFEIDTNDAARKLQRAVSEFDTLKAKFSPNMTETAKKFTWENAANQILELCHD
ncbi:glycosyltransferase family 4 protein [Candidatus Pacearchaeota archaeon]|jgi:glycosyltransferase involved in cell wall biosynthesis|nr:glycosyltransferase family 4 protein [Candidatus Pacearchaeota archaeon]